MKNLLIRAGVTSLALLGLVATGCSSDIDAVASGATGTISPVVSVDNSVVSARSSREVSVATLTPADLSLRLTAASGAMSRVWPSVNDFDPSTPFTVGAYTMEAFYGTPDDEGFEKPYVHGSSTLTVVNGENTPVSITARLANSMVSVVYTDAFRHYFTAYGARLHSTGGEYIDYAADETRPAYVKPGNVDLFVSFTKPSGAKAELQPASITAEPAQHYTITVDVNPETGGVGDAQLVITFDDNLTQEDVIIDLSDDLLMAPAPQVKPTGFTSGETRTFTAGTSPFDNLRMDVIAMGGMSAVTLTTSSASLLAQGWPAEINLLEATPQQQALLSSLGLVEHGLWQNPAKMAAIDFSGVTSSITYVEGDDNLTTFTLVVKDRLTKVSEIVTLSLQAGKAILNLSVPTAPKLYTRQFAADLTTNITDISTLKIQINRGDGNWQDCTIDAISGSDGSYSLTITAPVTTATFSLRAVCGKNYGNEVSVTAAEPDDKLNVSAADVWATKAYVTYSTASEARRAIRAARSGAHILWISTNGTDFTPASIAEAPDPAKVMISGLTPATAYTLKVTDPSDPNELGPTATFTTESAAAVPNGDFEQLTQTISVDAQNQGGEYTRTLLSSSMQNHQQVIVSEPTGWASTNNKTYNTGAANQNSWFVTPSVYNSTLTFVGTQATQGGMGGDKGTPDVYKHSAKSGENAMVIRNVAYDRAGTNPSRYKGTLAPPNYYSRNKPASIANRAAGKLFLGSYSFSGESETYSEGVAFTSRPASISGFYTYANDPQDTAETGSISVTILSGDKVIGTGSATLGASADYKQFTAPITYTDLSLKATSLRIMITSSNHAGTIAAETSSVKTTDHADKYMQESYGAVLTVDNLTFNY